MSERRAHLRLDKVFTVYITSPEGKSRGIGRNISSRGMYIETTDSMPLGGRLKVTLVGEDGTEMTCLCEVRYQVAITYGKEDGMDGFTRGVGLRIVGYEAREDAPIVLVDRERVMH